MKRARIVFGATPVAIVATVATMLAVGADLAAQGATAPPMQLVLAGKKFTQPIKGEAVIEFTKPATKREKNLVVTRILVRNASIGPVPRLTVSETWYDKGGAVVTGGRGTVNGLLQPGEVQTVVIETPYNAAMVSNNYNFSHANGTVKPARVEKIEDPNAPPPPAKAPARKR
jgi:hypothetical protein